MKLLHQLANHKNMVVVYLGGRQKDQKFKMILGYIGCSRPAWAAGESVLQNRKICLIKQMSKQTNKKT